MLSLRNKDLLNWSASRSYPFDFNPFRIKIISIICFLFLTLVIALSFFSILWQTSRSPGLTLVLFKDRDLQNFSSTSQCLLNKDQDLSLAFLFLFLYTENCSRRLFLGFSSDWLIRNCKSLKLLILILSYHICNEIIEVICEDFKLISYVWEFCVVFLQALI